jgi:putative superfamily III holin-X
MPTHGAENGHGASVGSAAREVAEHASALARLELELAGLELKQKAGALGAGVGLGAGAAVGALFAVGFLLAALAAGLATFLDVWLALLIVGLVLAAVTGLLAALARSSFRRGSPPVPEAAIAEARRTTEAIKG